MGHILQVWFEVSQNTNRVHFNGAMDGSRPLGMSLPMELLEMPGLPALLAELLPALDIGYEECTDGEGVITLIILILVKQDAAGSFQHISVAQVLQA